MIPKKLRQRMELIKALRRVNPVWKPELIERARGLWAKGYSVQQIADELGFNKNQTSGMISRNNFPQRKVGKTIITPAGSFDSIRAAAIHHGITPEMASTLANKPRSGWEFVLEEEDDTQCV